MHRPASSIFSSLLLAMTLMLAVGCSSTRPANEPDDQANNSERIYGGIAAIAGESAGSENTVTSEDADNQPHVSFEQLLTGQIAGVEVIERVGGGFSVRIRGDSSIMGSNEPLYVVDGMQVMHNTRQGLSWLNLKDVKKIEVLKRASDTAVYGVRGANGVVLITTKRGSDR